MHTQTGSTTSCLRAVNGQTLRWSTMSDSFASPPLRSLYSAVRSRESARSVNMWSPMPNSGSYSSNGSAAVRIRAAGGYSLSFNFFSIAFSKSSLALLSSSNRFANAR